jgi:riboflavin kinase/FMN adenylyltransferase
MHFDSIDKIQIQNTWLAIGIFDGLHLGHRSLLERLVKGAHQAGLQAVVLTFHPHPAVALGGKKDFACLNTPDERAALLENFGVDVVITQAFDRAFASQSAGDFMQRIITNLGVQHLVLGYDTALGRNREGNIPFLTQLGKKIGYTTEVVEPFSMGGKIVSSSAIRDLIREGDVTAAAVMLGDYYALSGEVIHGDGRGKRINLPTANVAYPEGKLIPAKGIYATWAWVADRWLRGATNIGINPTFTPDKRNLSLETHLLDFQGDLYGQGIKLEFVRRLRDEVQFDSVEALVDQIQMDIRKTKALLSDPPG